MPLSEGSSQRRHIHTRVVRFEGCCEAISPDWTYGEGVRRDYPRGYRGTTTGTQT